jgi:hypothetical protein
MLQVSGWGSKSKGAARQANMYHIASILKASKRTNSGVITTATTTPDPQVGLTRCKPKKI